MAIRASAPAGTGSPRIHPAGYATSTKSQGAVVANGPCATAPHGRRSVLRTPLVGGPNQLVERPPECRAFNVASWVSSTG